MLHVKITFPDFQRVGVSKEASVLLYDPVVLLVEGVTTFDLLSRAVPLAGANLNTCTESFVLPVLTTPY